LHDSDCNASDQVNQYVLIVGYGTENNEGYFLVKAHMGPDWGLDGMFKISDSTQGSGACGILLGSGYMHQISKSC